MKIAGVDEAGRGPLLGNLVICGAMIEESAEEKLRDLGVKDSKLLTPAARTKLAKILPDYVEFHLEILTPAQVDQAVFSTTTNLNWLEAETTAKILDILRPDRAIVDCPSPNLQAYQKYLAQKTSVSIEAKHKADLLHLIVGAASILAKVKRDAELDQLRQEIGLDFGSGYPSDPKTKTFLRQHWETHAHLFRQSWKPYQQLKSGKL